MNRVQRLLAAFSALAMAVSAPLAWPAFAQDSRLKTIVYDESEVVRINGRTKVQATIKFHDSESIENVAIGDSQAWQVTPNKRANLLFVKPLTATAKTNMTVVTNKRTYLFDLVASPRNAALYVLQFRYPEEEAAEEEARLAAIEQRNREQANASELAAANDPYAVADPAKLNFAWASEGDSDLFPARAYDNGEATFLTWPAGTAIPAILVTNYDGEEGPVNFTVRGDTVVVVGVPRRIILRSGRDEAVLVNSGPESAQANGAAGRDPALASNSISMTEVK